MMSAGTMEHKAEVQKFTSKKLVVDIKEVKRPDRDAQLVAENIACLLYTSHKRASYFAAANNYNIHDNKIPFISK